MSCIHLYFVSFTQHICGNHPCYAQLYLLHFHIKRVIQMHHKFGIHSTLIDISIFLDCGYNKKYYHKYFSTFLLVHFGKIFPLRYIARSKIIKYYCCSKSLLIYTATNGRIAAHRNITNTYCYQLSVVVCVHFCCLLIGRIFNGISWWFKFFMSMKIIIGVDLFKFCFLFF